MSVSGRARAERQPIELRRQQVLDAARGLVLDGGYSALSMEAIARDIAVSKPVVYKAYPDLESLLTALLDREYARVLQSMADVAEHAHHSDSGQEAFTRWLAGMAQLVMTEPDVWKVILLEEESAPDYLRSLVRDGRRALAAHLAFAVRPEENGELWFGSDDQALATQTILAVCEHFVRLMLLEPNTYTPQRMVEFGLNLIHRISR